MNKYHARVYDLHPYGDVYLLQALVMPGGPSVRADPALTEDPELKTYASIIFSSTLS